MDNDPHHLHPNFNYFYFFLILAPILVVVITYITLRLLNYLENRKQAEKADEGNSETIPENKGESR